jgi:hypothetical protein
MPKEEENKLPPPGSVYEVPAEGSLGLLALGYRGLDAWREKREEEKKKDGAKEK